jgi:hypothetical protein
MLFHLLTIKLTTYSTRTFWGWKRYLVRKIHGKFLAKFLQLRYQVSASYCQTAVVDESRTIITQTGNTQQMSNGRSAWDALDNTTPEEK